MVSVGKNSQKRVKKKGLCLLEIYPDTPLLTSVIAHFDVYFFLCFLFVCFFYLTLL